MTEPLAVIALNHAKLELWPSHVRTVFADGAEVCAAPNGKETLLDTVCHEVAHILHAEVLHGREPVCLRAVADGDGRRWTDDRREEEDFSFPAGIILAKTIRAFVDAYGSVKIE